MADLAKIKRNVAKLVDMQAPEADIDQYIAEEGVTVDDVRNFKMPAVVPEVVDKTEQTVGVFGKVPISEYQQGQRNILGNIFERPAAAVRSGIMNIGKTGGFAKGYQEGSINPTTSKTFQDVALENYVPKTKSTLLNFVGGIPASTIGLGLDMATNPANALISIAPEAPLIKPLLNTFRRTQIAQDLSKIGNSPIKQTPKLINEAKENLISKIIPNEKQLINIENEFGKVVKNGITKGIRPSVSGKQTIKKSDKFYNNANDAIKTIILNKDEVGQPKTVKELADAIDKTKASVYKIYHKTALEAGEKGANFNPDNITNNLVKLSKDISKTPETREYAAKLIPEIEELRGATPDIIEKRIAEYNNSLSGYYAGRTAKTQAQIDASLANLMRNELDNVIETATGEKYASLKRLYGSLKSIEKDVNNRATVLARQAPKNVFDLTDVFSGGDILRGVFTGNPIDVAKGASQIAIKNWYKKLNNADYIVKNMFKKADKLVSKSEKISAKIPKALTGDIVRNIPLSNTKLLTGNRLKGLPFKERLLPGTETIYNEGFTASNYPLRTPVLTQPQITGAVPRNQLSLPAPATTYGEGFTARALTNADKQLLKIRGKKPLNDIQVAGSVEARNLLRRLWEMQSSGE